MAVATFTFPTPYPTAVALSPANTVYRTDTNAPVAAVVAGSDATWTVTVTEPSPGLVYSFTLSITFPSGIGTASGTIQGSGSPTALYWTWTQFVNRWGMKNIATSSNKDNTSAIPNYVACQDSFNYAADEIHNNLRGGLLAVPLDFSAFSTLPLPASAPPTVSRWGMIIAYADLFDVRGWDDKSIVGNRMKRLLAQTYDDIALYKCGLNQLEAAPAKDHNGHTIMLGMEAVFGPPSLVGIGIPGLGFWGGVGPFIPGLNFFGSIPWVSDACLTFWYTKWFT